MKTCPICGSQMSLRASFQGRKSYRNKRTTYVCTCGYSTIKETRREGLIIQIYLLYLHKNWL